MMLKDLEKLEASGKTCRDCQYYPCCETVKDEPLPLCFGFLSKDIETNLAPRHTLNKEQKGVTKEYSLVVE